MIGTFPLPHTITVESSTTVKDRYNNDVLTYGNGRDVRGYLQPSVGQEYNIGRDAVEYDYTLWTAEPLDAHDRVIWEGRTYEVTGPTRPWSTPYGLHHFETYLRVMEG